MLERPKLEDLRIVHYPAPVLRLKAEDIRERDSYLQEIAARMNELMREAAGVGLAANQIAWPRRLMIINPAAEPGKYEAYINPAIIEREGFAREEEGCLSLPGVHARVRRARKVVVEATTLSGELVRIAVEGLAARAWQHEIDHLDGKLFVDKVGPAGRLMIRSRLRELEKHNQD